MIIDVLALALDLSDNKRTTMNMLAQHLDLPNDPHMKKKLPETKELKLFLSVLER